MTDAEQLGQFGHHPDPSTDYCVEVECLEGMAVDVGLGLASQWPFWGRLSRALKIAPPEDEYGPGARSTLKSLEQSILLSGPTP